MMKSHSSLSISCSQKTCSWPISNLVSCDSPFLYCLQPLFSSQLSVLWSEYSGRSSDTISAWIVLALPYPQAASEHGLYVVVFENTKLRGGFFLHSVHQRLYREHNNLRNARDNRRLILHDSHLEFSNHETWLISRSLLSINHKNLLSGDFWLANANESIIGRTASDDYELQPHWLLSRFICQLDKSDSTLS